MKQKGIISMTILNKRLVVQLGLSLAVGVSTAACATPFTYTVAITNGMTTAVTVLARSNAPTGSITCTGVVPNQCSKIGSGSPMVVLQPKQTITATVPPWELFPGKPALTASFTANFQYAFINSQNQHCVTTGQYGGNNILQLPPINGDPILPHNTYTIGQYSFAGGSTTCSSS